MTNDVVLSAALRNNLLSLQNTQSSIDTHQGRLATGKKVNSALDNPQSFFASQSLTSAASDLTNLLDSVGQSIQVINAANNGVTALTTLVSQAQAIANSAQSTLAGASTQASNTGTVNLGSGKLVGTVPGIVATNQLRFNITDPTSASQGFDLGAGGTGNHGTNAGATNIVSITATDTATDLVSKINDLNTGLTIPVISASLNSAGQLSITAVNGGDVNVAFGDTANGSFLPGTAPQDTAVQGFASALGFSIARFNQNGAANVGTVDFTQLQASTVNSKALYSVGPTTIATASTLLNGGIKDATNTALGTLVVGDTYTVTVGGNKSANLLVFGGATATTATIQTLIDGINNDTNIKSLVSASFNSTTGQISLSALSASATDIQYQLTTSTAAAKKLDLGFGELTGATATTLGVINDTVTEASRFGAAAGTLASLQTQYNTTLTQITALTNDTGYGGTNLLNGNNLTTFFNANRTSSLTTSGGTFNAGGLGLTNANFQNSAAISTSITQTQNALTTVRSFGSTLATNLSIIQNRQTFITSQINTLQTGSDALTNADQNQEGADLLALQTRQSLGITSLSLASQAQQAILKLF
jgi:flagellin-like hook-associated protein FlgL